MKHSFRANLFTGIVVLLPISLFILVIAWLYRFLDGLIEPIANFYNLPRAATVASVLVAVVIVLFLVGVASRTRPGRWFFVSLDKYVFSKLPGYNLIKQVLEPFIGAGMKKSFKSVALVDIWDNGTLMTAFVTDKAEKYTTVFVPTGPNPTSGNIYHIPNKRVRFIDAKVDQVLKSVISVGAGSRKLIEKLAEKKK